MCPSRPGSQPDSSSVGTVPPSRLELLTRRVRTGPSSCLRKPPSFLCHPHRSPSSVLPLNRVCHLSPALPLAIIDQASHLDFLFLLSDLQLALVERLKGSLCCPYARFPSLIMCDLHNFTLQTFLICDMKVTSVSPG